MPYHNALNDLNRNKGYRLDNPTLAGYITRVILNDRDPATTDALIRDAVKKAFSDDAERYEKYRQELIMRCQAKPGNKRRENEAMKLVDNNAFVEQYMGMVNLMINAANLQKRQYCREHGTTYKPYNSLPNCGLTGTEITDLMKIQLNSYKTPAARRFEVFKAFGIKNNKFMKELDEIRRCSYVTATIVESNEVHKVYLTKKLVEERLNSKGRLWKFFHRTETKAMKEYVVAAEDALKKANFYGVIESERNAAVDQYEKLGWAFDGFPQRFDDEFKDQEKSVDEMLAPALNKRQEEENKARALQEAEHLKQIEAQREKEQLEKQELEKKAEELEVRISQSQSEVDAIKNKELEDQFFEIRFRPSFEKEDFYKQYNAIKDVAEVITGDFWPKGVKTVFKTNFQKFTEMKSLMDAMGKVPQEAVDKRKVELLNKFIDMEEATKVKLKDGLKVDYEPITHQQVQDLYLQHKVEVDTKIEQRRKNQTAPRRNEYKEKMAEKDPVSTGKN